jgi:histidyl-tRNA synthetase
MSRADKLGATWVLIIGEDEVKNKKFQLKTMESGKQMTCTRKELLEILAETEREHE